jgi:arsenite methyltransferase
MYENGSLSKATGGVLRPGGMDLTGRMLSLCELSTGDCILDVGCGTGSSLLYIEEAYPVRLVGIDRSELLLQTGIRNHPHLPLACAWGRSLPVASEQMAVVLAECSLSAMSNTGDVLAEFYRVLKPAGRLALSDVYARNPEGIPSLRALPLSCGVRDAPSQAELLASLQTCGFEILFWEDCSDSLKHLATQITLAHGSMSHFWNCSAPAANPMDVQIAVNKAKLSYYLLVAMKRAG